MKQFILMIACLLVISCSVDRVTGSSSEPIEPDYKEMLQGFWYGDSIYTLWGDSLHQDEYNVNFIFDNDTLITKYMSTNSFMFNISNDTIIVNDFWNNEFLHSYTITSISEDSLRLKANWNNNSMLLVK